MNILILDDDKDTALKLASQAAVSLGHDVESTADPARFQQLVREKRFDLQIVDHQLPNAEESVGLSDGPAIVAVAAALGANLPTVFLTNYSPDCAERLHEFDPRLVYEVIEKPTDTDVRLWQKRINEGIESVGAAMPDHLPETLGVPVSETGTPFFKLSVEELHKLSEDERDELEARANVELHSSLLPIWAACDADWVKLQRVGDAIMVIDRGEDSALPTQDEVEDAEEEYGSGSLIVGRPLVVEEVSETAPSICTPGGHRNWRKYPYVRLSIGDRDQEFHLDTGSYESFMSRELLEDIGVSMPRTKFVVRTVEDAAGRADSQFHRPVQLPVNVDGPDGNVEFTVPLYAVKNWRSATNVFNRPCRTEFCPGSRDGQCGRRLGLMGRSLLYLLNSGVWHFRPETWEFVPVPGHGRKIFRRG